MHLEGLFLEMEPAARFTRGVLQFMHSVAVRQLQAILKRFGQNRFIY